MFFLLFCFFAVHRCMHSSLKETLCWADHSDTIHNMTDRMILTDIPIVEKVHRSLYRRKLPRLSLINRPLAFHYLIPRRLPMPFTMALAPLVKLSAIYFPSLLISAPINHSER